MKMKHASSRSLACPRITTVVATAMLQACVAYAQSTPTSEVSAVAQAGPAFPITAFRFEGNQLVDEPPLQQAAAFSLGNARHLSDLLALKKAIAEVYEARGWRMVAIGLPTRIEADGLVVITLHEQQLAGVQVSGHKTSGQADIRAALPSLRENQALNFKTLASELALANDNPVRQLSVDFSADEQSGILAKVQVQESDPFRMGLTLDNTGTPDSGRSRMGASLQHHNLWGRGHSLVAGLSTSDLGPDRLVQAHAAYQAPLPSAGGQLKLIASYSNANSGTVANVFNISGQGYSWGAHYTHFLHRDATSQQTLDFGYDEKSNRNTVDFFGTNLGVDVDARPLSLSLQASRREAPFAWSSSVSYLHNLVTGPRNDDATYNASRAGASADWSVWRVAGDATVTLPADWQLQARMDGQHAGRALISGEQFGLGGNQGVRGFDERAVPGDDGLRVSMEIYTPLLLQQSSRFLAFADVGAMRRANPQAGEPAQATIASVGLGWRWRLGQHLTAHLDAAHVTKGASSTATGEDRLHFQLSASF